MIITAWQIRILSLFQLAIEESVFIKFIPSNRCIFQKHRGDKTRTVEGLHRISEKELNGLDDEAFTRLRRAGVLTLAYAQMFSTAHLPKVGELANAHANHSAAKKRQADEAKTRSNSMGISDSLDIDWSKIGG